MGVDTGGTFTDLVLALDGRLVVHKLASTPDAPESAIHAGVDALEQAEVALELVHGSTVATNMILEGKGARCVYLANRGFADVLSIGRQARAEIYELQPPRPAPPVPPERCLEISARVAADGSELEPVAAAELASLVERVRELAPEAIAINLLFSFLDEDHERALESALSDALPESVFICRSSRVLPEYREYERGIATWLNARVGPGVAGYLRRLEQSLPRASVRVMHSAAGTVAAEQAADRGAHLLLSGPAGGLIGARYMAERSGFERIMTLDMGGTSTDVALIDGGVGLTSEGSVGGYPVMLPMVDMHTIGAGGGSIARVDEAGMLQVGPESAGAVPGPACYGQGGTEATVTDAHLVLGHLLPERFLGGRMRLDTDAARRAVATVAKHMDAELAEAALGIVALAGEHMTAALRRISVQRGYDPAEFVLVSFGGAGGLHVCGLAEAMGMDDAMVPAHAGVLSALGMLVAPPARDRSRTLARVTADLDAGEVESLFTAMETDADSELLAEGLDASLLERRREVDLRYLGQSATLRLPWTGLEESAEAFHRAHADRYGHRLDEPVELVNIRVEVSAPAPELDLEPLAPGPAEAVPDDAVRVHGETEPVPVFERGGLGADTLVRGPALVCEPVSTIRVARGWAARHDAWGNLILRRSE